MSKNKGQPSIAIITGPTGGHFFPGLAIAEELVRDGAYVSFFVPRRKYLVSWLEKKGFEYKFIPEAKISARNLLFPFTFTYAFFRACLFIAEEKPGILVITGSYATVPFLLAAKLRGIKIFVHEQNFLLGKTTKFAALFADRIALSYPNFGGLPENKTVVTGFPVISDFKKEFTRTESLKSLGLNPERKTVLVFGGSQGASFLNSLITDNLEYFKNKNLQFIHLAGKDKEFLENKYLEHGIIAKVFNFYFQMARLYSATDVAVCRAGGGTLAEINFWKIPAVVVPYPHAGEHQRYNALYFLSRKGCNMLQQKSEGSRGFVPVFEKTLKELDSIKRNLYEISVADSDKRTVREIMETLNG